ncbi:c-type cytochrome [Corallococcus exiguus]|uniref:c-type cytochrome n=1 Tax=Corallococcus TaxID=83461 RepID=UPI000EDB55AC|nr:MULTISPECIES: c-type cytochrome [Corallococcus]NPC68608.1 c-type cytochrome [Corallococcus exiguus]RKI04214.1 hypothetical protein D7Y04_04515 [Corallococcus sp. AB038B]
MKRLHLLFLLLAPGIASAQASGETAFKRACVRCHVAQAPSVQAKKQSRGLTRSYPGAGPNLGEVMSRRSVDQVRTWIDNPTKVNRKTGCDTRRLADSEKNALIQFLATRAQPPPPPRDEMLEQEKRKGLARQSEQRQSQPGQQNPQQKGSK